MKKTSTKSTPASAESKISTTPKAVEAVAKRLKAAKAAQAKAPAAAPEKAPAKAKPAKAPKAEAPAKAAPAPKAPKTPKAAKTAEAAPVVTKIVATIDVGFGNHLTIRGDGPGLSWETGVAMACIDGTSWVWSTAEAAGPITFKVLANDLTWCAGEDRTVQPGDQLSFTPSFE